MSDERAILLIASRVLTYGQFVICLINAVLLMTIYADSCVKGLKMTKAAMLIAMLSSLYVGIATVLHITEPELGGILLQISLLMLTVSFFSTGEFKWLSRVRKHKEFIDKRKREKSNDQEIS